MSSKFFAESPLLNRLYGFADVVMEYKTIDINSAGNIFSLSIDGNDFTITSNSEIKAELTNDGTYIYSTTNEDRLEKLTPASGITGPVSDLKIKDKNKSYRIFKYGSGILICNKAKKESSAYKKVDAKKIIVF